MDQEYPNSKIFKVGEHSYYDQPITMDGNPGKIEYDTQETEVHEEVQEEFFDITEEYVEDYVEQDQVAEESDGELDEKELMKV